MNAPVTPVTSRRTFLTAGSALLAGASQIALPNAAHGSTPTGTRTGLRIVTADDPQYAALVRGTNQRWVGSPTGVIIPTDTEQVTRAVQQAVAAGRRVAVRSGGHCYEDFVTSPDIHTVVDMSALDGIAFNEERGAFAVGAGARLGDLYGKLYKQWGVVLPAGNCPTVGAGGHISGGGYGSLSRRNGLAVDHLFAVEVVVVDHQGQARAVVATADPSDPNHDLFWAHTGGGGGNFGVVTKYWLRSPGTDGSDPTRALPRPPEQVWLNEVTWPWSDLDEAGFARLMNNHGTWHERNSAAESPFANLFSQLKPLHKSNGSISMVTQIDAGLSGAEEMILGYVRAVGDGVPAAIRTVQHRKIPWMQATWWTGFTGPDPTVRFKGKSTYLRKSYPQDQVRTMYRHLTREDFDNPSALLMIASYGGQVNTVAPAATAVPQRDSIIKMQVVSIWNDPAQDAANVAWVRDLYRDLYAPTGGVPVPGDVTDGCFVNYCDVDLGDPSLNTSGVTWAALYYKDNYPRLQAVKARWDPSNVFRHAQSVTAV